VLACLRQVAAPPVARPPAIAGGMPMVIMFWNIQRLGAGTGLKRMETFESVALELGLWQNVDLFLLCEVTSNVESKHINKQVHKRARAPKKDKASLGYAAFEQLNIADDLSEVTLQKQKIDSFSNVTDLPTSGYKKGGTFDKVSKRHVAHAGEYEGMQVYVYHANSSTYAKLLVPWVAEHLQQEDGGKFVLVGDFNAEPLDVKTSMQNFEIDDTKFSIASNGATHNTHSFGGPTKTYDYAIGGAAVKNLQVKKIDILPVLKQISKEPEKDMSDHMPILVAY
jgi:endonuclease/exonuclease/phosphatase family metal-dependent hydrolase